MCIEYKGYVIYLINYGWRIKDTNYSPATLEEAMEIVDSIVDSEEVYHEKHNKPEA